MREIRRDTKESWNSDYKKKSYVWFSKVSHTYGLAR